MTTCGHKGKHVNAVPCCDEAERLRLEKAEALAEITRLRDQNRAMRVVLYETQARLTELEKALA